MLKCQFAINKDQCLKVLCLGSHCDDIEIGCGGTILKLIKKSRDTAFYWVIFSSDQQRRQEAIDSANAFLMGVKEKNIVIKTFRNSFFPFLGAEIKEYFEKMKKEFSPDIIFTHSRDDRHQDHRLISDLTWNTFRDHLILEYEIPKYDADLGSPNFFVHLNRSLCKKKVEILLNSFVSQKPNHWFTKDSFYSILNIRGIESNSPSRYAEGFYCRKIAF